MKSVFMRLTSVEEKAALIVAFSVPRALVLEL